LRDLGLQRFDFGLEGFVFEGFALEVVAGERHAVAKPFGGEQIGDLVEFVTGTAKGFDLDVTFFDEAVEEVVDLGDADAQHPGQFTLAEVGVFFEGAQDAKVAVLPELVAIGWGGHGEGHEWWSVAPVWGSLNGWRSLPLLGFEQVTRWVDLGPVLFAALGGRGVLDSGQWAAFSRQFEER
jgi:hypothetical protein